MDPVIQMVIAIAVLLMLGVLSEIAFSKTGIPDALPLVVVGILCGPVLNLVSVQILEPAIPFFGAIALVILLSGSGYKMILAEIISAAPRALLLAVTGFVFSIMAICAFGYIGMQVEVFKPGNMLTWVMIGSIVGGSSSLVVMPTMELGEVESRVSGLLDIESSATDALCIVMTMVFIGQLVRGDGSLAFPVISLVRQFGFGILIGGLIGMAMLPFLPSLQGKDHMYMIFLSTMLILYGITQHLGGNGPIAVLTCSIIMGNARTIVKRLMPSVQEFSRGDNPMTMVIHSQLAFIVKAFFFTLIGVMFPLTLRTICIGLVATLFLLIFRFPAVWLSTIKTSLTSREKLMVCITFPRGIAAGVLASLPVYYGITDLENLAPAVFSVVVFSIVLFSIFFKIVAKKNAAASTTRDTEQTN